MGRSFKGKEGAFRQDVKYRWRRSLTVTEENQGSMKNKKKNKQRCRMNTR